MPALNKKSNMSDDAKIPTVDIDKETKEAIESCEKAHNKSCYRDDDDRTRESKKSCDDRIMSP